MASSSEEGSVPFDKFAAATRLSDLVRVLMKNKGSPQAMAAARAEARSLSQALGRNLARMEQEEIENPAVAAPPPAPRDKVPLETLDDLLAAGDAFFGRAPEPAVPEEKPEKEKKYRRVKLSKKDIQDILSYKHSPFPHPPESFLTDEQLVLDSYPVPKEQVVQYFTLLFSACDGVDDEFLEMQKEVREEYKKKGYAHVWVTDDEDEAPRAPRPAARRRARPGVMKHKGGTKKLS